MQDFVLPPLQSTTSSRTRQDSSFESGTGSFHSHPEDSPQADDHDIDNGGASEDEDPSYGERKRSDASHTSSTSGKKSKAKNGAGSPGSGSGERKTQSGGHGNRLDEGEKKVRNRQSSQRFRNRVKERQNAVKERLRWLEDRVLLLTEELKIARSGGGSTAGFRIDDHGPLVPPEANEAQNPEYMVKWLKSENERLKYGLRKAEAEVERLRNSPPSPPEIWPYPLAVAQAHHQYSEETSQIGPVRRSSHAHHLPAQYAALSRRGSLSTSTSAGGQHSRVSSYSSSYGSHSYITASSSSSSSQIQHPPPLDFANARYQAFHQQQGVEAFSRPRSQSAASDWTTASSPAGSVYSGRSAILGVSGGASMAGGYGLGLAQYMSTLPTVPGSATIPTESFADIQVAGVDGSSNTASYERKLPGAGFGEGPTPTIASNATWRLAQATMPLQQEQGEQHQLYFPSSAAASGGMDTSLLVPNGAGGQYASYPSQLPMYRTQSSAPGFYTDSSAGELYVDPVSSGAQRPASALPQLQTVFSKMGNQQQQQQQQDSGTITPEELLRGVQVPASEDTTTTTTMQDISVPPASESNHKELFAHHKQ